MVSADPVVTTRPATTDTGNMTHPATMNPPTSSWPNKKHEANHPTASDTATPTSSSVVVQNSDSQLLMDARAGPVFPSQPSSSLSRLPSCSSLLNGVFGGAAAHSEIMLSPRPAPTQQQQQPRPRQQRQQQQHQQQHSASAAAAAVAAANRGAPKSHLMKSEGDSNRVPEVPQAFTISEQDYSHRMRTLSNMSFPDFFHRNRTLSNNSLSGFDFFPRDRSLSNNSLVLPTEYASAHQQQQQQHGKPANDAHFEVLRDYLSPPPSALAQQQLNSMENTQQANYINHNLQYHQHQQQQQQQQQHQQYMQHQQQHHNHSYGARAAAAAAAAAGGGIGSLAYSAHHHSTNQHFGHIDADAQQPPHKKTKSSTSDAAAALTGLQYGSGSVARRGSQPIHHSSAAAATAAAVAMSSESAAAAGSLLGIGSTKFAVPIVHGPKGLPKSRASSSSSARKLKTASATTSSSASRAAESSSSSSSSSSYKPSKSKSKSSSAQLKALKAIIPADLPVTSKFRGVCWYRRTGKWVCQIKVNGMRRHVGYFACEYEAAKAYDKALFEMIEMAVRDPNGSKRPGVARKRVFNPDKRKPNLTAASAADSKAADVAKAKEETENGSGSASDGAKAKKAHDATVKQLLKLQQRLAEDFKRQSAK